MDKATRTKVRDAAASVADRVIFKKDGTVEARRSYFYRHSETAEKFATRVLSAVARAGCNFEVIKYSDRWAPWPRDSYFLVRLKERST